MPEPEQLRPLYVAGAGDALFRALAEQRRHAAAWSVSTLDMSSGAPSPEALVIVDFEDAVRRADAVTALRDGGFGGPLLVVGGDPAAGAEIDPVRRPVRLGTLLAKLAAYAALPAEAAMRLGPYDFIQSERLMRHVETGAVIRLTELEHKLLSFLAVDGGMVEREQLLDEVWGYNTDADTHTVETHIWRLRQKIETEDPETRFLLTEAGGYRLFFADSDKAG